jgi:hypothetical protein
MGLLTLTANLARIIQQYNINRGRSSQRVSDISILGTEVLAFYCEGGLYLTYVVTGGQRLWWRIDLNPSITSVQLNLPGEPLVLNLLWNDSRLVAATRACAAPDTVVAEEMPPDVNAQFNHALEAQSRR